MVHWKVRLRTGLQVAQAVDLEALARSAAAGDATAIELLLEASKPLVMSNSLKFLPNRLDAEEATQGALLAVAQRIGSFEFRSKYTTWLHQITTNASIDRCRLLKRRRSELVDPPAHTAVAGSSPSVRATRFNAARRGSSTSKNS